MEQMHVTVSSVVSRRDLTALAQKVALVTGFTYSVSVTEHYSRDAVLIGEHRKLNFTHFKSTFWFAPNALPRPHESPSQMPASHCSNINGRNVSCLSLPWRARYEGPSVICSGCMRNSLVVMTLLFNKNEYR